MASTSEQILLSNTLQAAVTRIIKKNGFVEYKQKVMPGSEKGDNYAGIVYKIQINGTKENGKEEDIGLFCKIPKDNDMLRYDFMIGEAFVRENIVYNEIITDFKQFEKEKGIENGWISYGECLATNSIEFEEHLVMKDLSKDGYVMFDRLADPDLAHSELVMKEIAKFHAFSLAIKDQKPEILHKYIKRLPEMFLREPFEGKVKEFVEAFVTRAVDDLEFEGIYLEKWKYFYENFIPLLRDVCKGELAEPYACISHGDLWNNNVMFKYENGVPIATCILDWQMARYASPILDIAKYIFFGNDKAFRDLHYETLINIYYKSFTNFLKQLGSDPEKVFPHSAFQEQLRKFSIYGLGMVLFVSMILTTGDEIQNLDEMADDNNGPQEKIKIIANKRISDVLKDMVDLGYL